MTRTLDRRSFLRTTGVLAAGLATGTGCAAVAGTATPAPATGRFRPLAPVRVSPERVIRSVAGLRPFRASGFVVRAERIGETDVIHNYGHGGGGISLSWGSSSLAVALATEIAAEHDLERFAVLGCGVMGLTTARLLQDRGFEVTIYARDLPPHTTSNVGGGQWAPFTVSDPDRTTPGFDAQFERAARLSHARFQTMVGSRYGVRWIENYAVRTQPFSGGSGPLADLYFDEERFGPGEHPFGPERHVRRFTTMLVEPNTFLPALLDDILVRGGRVEPREFHALEEVLALDEAAVINCTGLGSRTLFGDYDLVPVRGQLAILLPQPEVDYVTLAGGAYMFPRSDGIVLGGSQERGQWSTDPSPEVEARILAQNREVFSALGG